MPGEAAILFKGSLFVATVVGIGAIGWGVAGVGLTAGDGFAGVVVGVLGSSIPGSATFGSGAFTGPGRSFVGSFFGAGDGFIGAVQSSPD